MTTWLTYMILVSCCSFLSSNFFLFFFSFFVLRSSLFASAAFTQTLKNLYRPSVPPIVTTICSAGTWPPMTCTSSGLGHDSCWARGSTPIPSSLQAPTERTEQRNEMKKKRKEKETKRNEKKATKAKKGRMKERQKERRKKGRREWQKEQKKENGPVSVQNLCENASRVTSTTEQKTTTNMRADEMIRHKR